MIISAGTLLLATSLGFGLVDAWQPRSTAIATVTPCPSPSQWTTPAPITVTTQYQPVSTCEPVSEACVKNKCWMQYSYSTFDFVSTVIPCPLALPSSVSTITKTDQDVLVSRSSKTITNTFITSLVIKKWRKPITVTTTASTYTTIVKEWSAPYKDLGPFAIPGYKGSGICTQCKGPNGQNKQSLDVVECRQSSNKPAICRGYPEVWIFDSKPALTHTASAACSRQTSVTAAGTYVFKFPQHEPPSTVTVSPRTLTYTIGGRVLTTTSTITTTLLPAETGPLQLPEPVLDQLELLSRSLSLVSSNMSFHPLFFQTARKSSSHDVL